MYSIIAEQKPNTHIHMRIVFEYLQILYANKYFAPVQYLLLFARNEKQQTKVCRRQRTCKQGRLYNVVLSNGKFSLFVEGQQ